MTRETKYTVYEAATTTTMMMMTEMMFMSVMRRMIAGIDVKTIAMHYLFMRVPDGTLTRSVLAGSIEARRQICHGRLVRRQELRARERHELAWAKRNLI